MHGQPAFPLSASSDVVGSSTGIASAADIVDGANSASLGRNECLQLTQALSRYLRDPSGDKILRAAIPLNARTVPHCDHAAIGSRACLGVIHLARLMARQVASAPHGCSSTTMRCVSKLSQRARNLRICRLLTTPHTFSLCSGADSASRGPNGR
jgi:hypothetical protein